MGTATAGAYSAIATTKQAEAKLRMPLLGRFFAAFVVVTLASLPCTAAYGEGGIIAYNVNISSSLLLSELQALVRLRGSVANTPSADPCSAWVGVECEGGHVVSLFLPNAGGGAFWRMRHLRMEPLQHLPFLHSLRAPGVPIRGGVLPAWLGHRLPRLRLLDLSSTSLHGNLPSSLGLLSSLYSLSLASNNLSGAFPAGLHSLHSLNLSFNHFATPFPSSLLNSTNLALLDLSGNAIVGTLPSNLAESLPRLTHLALGSNLLRGPFPPSLLQLKNLTHLNMAYNRLSGSLPESLDSLAELTFLSLSHNRFQGSIPVRVSNCINLRFLRLSNNLLSGRIPSELTELGKLVEIDFSFNGLTGLVPPSFFGMPNLRTLQLSHNLLYGFLDLERSIRFHIDVSYNFFNGTLPEGLPEASAMRNCFSDALRQHSKKACVFFYERRGLTLNGSSPPPHKVLIVEGSRRNTSNAILEVPPKTNKWYGNLRLVALLGGVAGIAIIIALVVAFALCTARKTSERVQSAEVERASPVAVLALPPENLKHLGEPFSLEQLRQLTDNFSTNSFMAAGHSGEFYKGVLESGVAVVVRRVRCSGESYMHEFEMLRKTSHTRIISLLGHCLVCPEEKYLVYKYMPNRDLATALKRRANPGLDKDVVKTLDWITRMKIATGVAEALTYLHHECTPPVVHRSVKSSSILLDDKFEVRLGSLSDARVQDGDAHPGLITRLLGMSQSHNQIESVVSCAKDVYGFGKVLLELISGKVGISNLADPRTDAWVELALPLINIYEKDPLPRLADPTLILHEDLLQEVWAVAIIAKACLNPRPSRRPTMRHILRALENPHKVVREENRNGSMVSRTSSHSSWNEALFGGCRTTSSSQSLVITGAIKEENEDAFSTNRAGHGLGQIHHNSMV